MQAPFIHRLYQYLINLFITNTDCHGPWNPINSSPTF